MEMSVILRSKPCAKCLQTPKNHPSSNSKLLREVRQELEVAIEGEQVARLGLETLKRAPNLTRSQSMLQMGPTEKKTWEMRTGFQQKHTIWLTTSAPDLAKS